MKIDRVDLRVISMTLKTPFSTHLETVREREGILVEVVGVDGVSGFGEVVAFSSPWYTEETVKTAYHMLKDFFIPLLFKHPITHPREASLLLDRLKRNQMAKAGLEMALWDLYAKQQNISLAKLLGGTQSFIPSGVVVGAPTIEQVLAQINEYVIDGYKRAKLKIHPGHDHLYVQEVRKAFPNLQLMADANSAYVGHDWTSLKQLDDYHLLMIEQPLGFDDIIEHAKLQRELTTPICLDESIVTVSDARQALELGSCQVINIKPGRVGGLASAVAIHDLCLEASVPVWCGGMLEFGVSRAHNIALASLPNFTIAGDISASSRYWDEDITMPEVVVKNGLIEVPTGAGIGVDINWRRLNDVTKFQETFHNT